MTGVQTCALPISEELARQGKKGKRLRIYDNFVKQFGSSIEPNPNIKGSYLFKTGNSKEDFNPLPEEAFLGADKGSNNANMVLQSLRNASAGFLSNRRNIRSVYAAFDPEKSTSSTLLAAAPFAAVGGAGLTLAGEDARNQRTVGKPKSSQSARTVGKAKTN